MNDDQSPRSRAGRRARRALGHALKLTERALSEFFDDRCPQHAAAISYYALFSLFPLAILAVVVFGIVLSEQEFRDSVIDFLLDRLPLSRDEGRADLRELLEGVTDDPGRLGVLGLAGLALAASGLMGAIRTALNAAWDAGVDGRPPLLAKALDLLLVLGTGVLVAASLGVTIVNRLGEDVARDIGGIVGDALLEVGEVVPVALSFAMFAFLYRVVPARRVRFRDLWPGALFAALAYELAKTGFAVYLENFRDYSAVYGSLGAIVAFLVFVFVAANVFLLGAEIASEWPAVRAGTYDGEPSQPVGKRLRAWLRGLVVAQR